MQVVGVWSLAGELKIPHALQPKNQNIKEKQYCNKFSKDLGGKKKEMAPLDSVHSPCRWLRHFLQPLYLFPPMDFQCLTWHWFVEKDGVLQAPQVVPVVKNLPVNAGDTDSIPGLGRFPGEGNGNPLQYSYLENPMDRGLQSIESQRVGHNWTHTHMHVHMGSPASASVSPTCWMMSHVCQASEGLLSPTRKSTGWCKCTKWVDFPLQAVPFQGLLNWLDHSSRWSTFSVAGQAVALIQPWNIS